MKTLKFKTNVSCGGCIAKVSNNMDEINGISQWSVDTNNPFKILTVKAEKENAEDVIKAITSAGYKADLISVE